MRFKETDLKTIQTQLNHALSSDENIVAAYQLRKDSVVCTNKRLIVIAKKRKFLSAPYDRIQYWESECNSKFKMKGLMTVYIQNMQEGLKIDFDNAQAAQEFQKILSDYALR